MSMNHYKRVAALKYNKESGQSPTLIAKGSGSIAEKILETAKANGIHVQEDPSLMEVLYKLDLNQQIPPELYQVVAELLSFVYKADKKHQR